MKSTDAKLLWIVIGLSAAALLAFLQLLSATNGPIGLGVPPSAAAQAPADPAAIPTESVLPITLLDSAAASAHFDSLPGSKPGGHASHLKAWRQALDTLHADVRVVGDAELTSATPDGRVLVLPAVTVLSDAAVTALETRIQHGQAVVASWQLGLVRPNGSWRGYGVLERLFGLRSIPLLSGDVPALRFGAMRTGGPLGVGLPAGGRFEIQPFDAPLLLEANTPDAEFVRWELLPLAGPFGDHRPAAVVHRGLGQGRVAWLNFELATATPVSQRMITTIVKNALRWTAGIPRVAVDRWPGSAAAAVMVGVDTEDRFENGGVAAAALATAKVPGTFFCVSSLAERYPTVVAQLAAAGEVASHTDDHRVVAGRPSEEQEQHLRDSAATLQRLGVPPVLGFRPPEEESDDGTVLALARAGYAYLAGPREKDRAEPTLLPNGIVVVPRVVRDDIYFLNQGLADDPDALVASFLADVANVKPFGGLAFVSLHSQSLERAAVRTALPRLLAALAQDDLWRATGSDIARWWVARDGIAVRPELTSPQRLQLTVTTRVAVAQVGFTVFLPRRPERVSLGGAVSHAPRDLRILAGDDPAIRVVLDTLAAGETRIIDVDLL